MSCINLLANDVWSDADIVAHGRAVIAATVSPQRQTELQTIMLGQVAGIRAATASELQEIGQVQAIMELTATANDLARADMAALNEVLAHEADPTEKTLSEAAQAVYALRHPADQAPTDLPEGDSHV